MKAGRLLIVADGRDAPARDWADRIAAVLVTPRDLSFAGWRFRPDAPETTVVVAGGAVLPVADIGCVLTRLPAVAEADLLHIAAGDRGYVAAEMTAFLLALLAALDRPVVNRPTAQCLCGPQGTDAAWRRTARGLGLAAAPLRLRATLGHETVADAAGHLVAVVGETAFGAIDHRQAAAAVALARGVGADLLSIAFDPDAPLAVLRAYPEVDLDDAAIADAVSDFCAAKAAA